MQRTTRRKFLKRTSAGVAGAAGLALPQVQAALRGSMAFAGSKIPAHRPMVVPAVHAYSLERSVIAGQTLQLCLSATVPGQLSIVRLGHKIDDPGGDMVWQQFPQFAPEPQPIHPGSYVHVERSLTDALNALTLECWMRPWKTEARAGILTQHDSELGGLGLFLTKAGGLAFLLDEAAADEQEIQSTAGGLLKKNTWHHIVATWDGREKMIWLNGVVVGAWPLARHSVQPSSAPLRLAASGENGAASHFLDADLAMPAIYDHALSEEQILARFKQRGLEPARGKGVIACWPLREERGDRVADIVHRRVGRIINHGTWMIGGPSFKAEVPRFEGYNPARDPERGHGLRFASDDLYDCRWRVTHEIRIPRNAKSGLYAARIHFNYEGKPRIYHHTFIVRPPLRAKKAPILVLCSTNTWIAYSGTPFAVTPAELKPVFGTGGLPGASAEPPCFNFYRGHAAGQGTYQIGLRMPWPVAGPYILYGGPTHYSHLMRGERFAHVWLEEAGYEFDVISDLDLHREPDLLQGYRAVLINGHSEYWSIEMYEGLRNYLKRGGDAVVLSGNSLFWRVSYDEDGTVLECRKVDAPGDQLPPSRRGECWHSQDGRRGGLMRECGYPGWKLVGLETLGWNNQADPKQFGPYIVERADHFLFQKPEPVNVRNGQPIGQGPDGSLPRANGHEIDIRLSTLAALQEQPSPPGASMPADPAGMVRLANGIIPWKIGGAAYDYFFRAIKPKNDQGGEMIYWERPDGGRIFHGGSIGSGWALHADPQFQRLMKNVLHHFGIPVPKKA